LRVLPGAPRRSTIARGGAAENVVPVGNPAALKALIVLNLEDFPRIADKV
jgi:hypothetical protein